MNLKKLNEFKGKRIFVIGDMMVDRYICGSSSRLSPEAPVPIVDVNSEFFTLGGAANVVNNILRLGGVPIPYGVLGNDEYGDYVRCKLKDCGVDVSELTFDKNRPTTIKTRILSGSQHIVRIDKEDRTPFSISKEEEDNILELSNSCDVTVISDYGKGMFTIRLAETLYGAKTPVVLDPNKSNFILDNGIWFEYIDVATPNMDEAKSFFNNMISDIEELADRIFYYTAISTLFITDGSNGIHLIGNDGEYEHIPAHIPKKIYDITGAGDTVTSVLALGYAVGMKLSDIAKLANYAASVVIGDLGTATVSIDKLIEGVKNV